MWTFGEENKLRLQGITDFGELYYDNHIQMIQQLMKDSTRTIIN